MAEFIYTIADKNFQKINGKIEAATAEDAARAISKEGWFIISLKNKDDYKSVSSVFSRKPKFSGLERIVFTDHLAAMIESGTPIVEALETYQDEELKKKSLVIAEIIRQVEQGKKLSESMRGFPGVFSSYYISLVAAGELTGRLDETFKHLAQELRREHEFKERIKSSLIYPVLVLIVAFVVIIFLVFLVIPKITEMTKSFGGDMPLATRIVSNAAGMITIYGPYMLVATVALVVATIAFLRNPKTKVRLDPYLLRLPVVGIVVRQYVLARFLRMVGSCLSYGVPLTVSFDTVADVVGNSVYKKACQKIKQRVMRGGSLSQSMSAEDKSLFSPLIIKTIRGAEKTGSMDAAFLRLSVFFERDIDRSLKRLTDLIEPSLTIVLGIIVGAIAIAVIAPIYQLTAKIR